MSERTPSLAHVIRRALEAQMIALRVALPGRIEKFDPATQLAEVKPLLKETYETEDGGTQTDGLPVVVDVPVYSPGGQDFALTMPVKPGDSCWLMFSDRSLDLWNENGGEQDPGDPRRHDLSDAVCIVGIRPKAGKLSEFDADAIQLGKMGGPRVRVKSDGVHLGVNHGEDSTELAAIASKVKQELEALRSTVEAFANIFTAHVHPVSGAATLTTVTPAPHPAAVQDVKCSKVFIK